MGVMMMTKKVVKPAQFCKSASQFLAVANNKAQLVNMGRSRG